MKTDTNTTNQTQLENVDIQWTPVDKGGSNVKSEELLVIDENTLVIESTFGHFLLSLVFIIISSIVLFSGVVNALSSSSDPFTPFIFILVGGYFCMMSLKLFFKSSTLCKTFDRKTGEYIETSARNRKVQNKLLLSEIIALQIVKELCKGNKVAYYSYELNMVLQDKSRINLMDHNNEGDLTADAKQLAEFLGIPILSK